MGLCAVLEEDYKEEEEEEECLLIECIRGELGE